MKITKSDFGTLNTGENIYIYHMENANGAYVEVINFGCRLVKIVVPDRDRKMTDVCLGFDSMEDYARDNASLGAVVGRVANRIKDGHFCLDGKEYHVHPGEVLVMPANVPHAVSAPEAFKWVLTVVFPEGFKK